MLIKTNDLFIQLLKEAKNIFATFQLNETKTVIDALEALAIKYKENDEQISLANPFHMVNPAIVQDWNEMLNRLDSFKWIIEEALLEVKENLQDLYDSEELARIKAELNKLNEAQIKHQQEFRHFATIDELACFLTDMPDNKTRLEFITHYQGDFKPLILNIEAYECLLACFEDASLPFFKQLRFNLSHLSANTSQMGLHAVPNLSAQTNAEKDKPDPSSLLKRN